MRGGNFDGTNPWIPRRAARGEEGMQGASQLLIFANSDILLWGLSVTHWSQGAPDFWIWCQCEIGCAGSFAGIRGSDAQGSALLMSFWLGRWLYCRKKGDFFPLRLMSTAVWSTDTSQPQAGSSTWKISFSSQANREHFLSLSIS